MKIVDICESYSEHGGGVRTYVQHKLTAAARHGHELVIVAPGTENREQRVAGGRIVWVESPRAPFDDRYGLFSCEADVHAVLRREDPDIIEGSSPWNGGKFAASFVGRGKKAFVFHTDPVAVWPQTFFGHLVGFDRIDRWFKPYWRRLAALANGYDTTVVSGSWLADRLGTHGVERPSVVPFGIDKRRFSPASRDPDLRARLLAACGAPPHAKLLVAISRLDPEKRVATVIEGFERAARHQPMGLVIFGRGALQGWYARKAARTPGVHLHGYVSDRTLVARALASADAFVHGSAAETYGLVVAEAICSGVPVVVPDRGGAGALARPDYAERYAAGDAEACGAAIGRLLTRDPQRLAYACAQARRQICTMDDHFDQLFGLYARLAGRERIVPATAAWRAAS